MTKRTRPGNAPRTLERLLWVETNRCVIWPHAVDSRTGYGRMKHPDAKRVVNVHREVLERTQGPPPAGMEAAHSCGVRRCMNKRHLRWATRKDNMLDRLEHGTMTRGERSGQSVLTELQVWSIVARFDTGESCAVIAPDFGVGRETIRDIRAGRTWAWLTGL